MMKWMLIACLVMAGASCPVDAEEPGTITDTLWGCAEGWHQTNYGLLPRGCERDEPTCGEGPHEITIREDGPCPIPPPKLVRSPDGVYEWHPDPSITNAGYCSRSVTHTEIWTDWPECEGAVVVEASDEDERPYWVIPTDCLDNPAEPCTIEDLNWKWSPTPSIDLVPIYPGKGQKTYSDCVNTDEICMYSGESQTN